MVSSFPCGGGANGKARVHPNCSTPKSAFHLSQSKNSVQKSSGPIASRRDRCCLLGCHPEDGVAEAEGVVRADQLPSRRVSNSPITLEALDRKSCVSGQSTQPPRAAIEPSGGPSRPSRARRIGGVNAYPVHRRIVDGVGKHFAFDLQDRAAEFLKHVGLQRPCRGCGPRNKGIRSNWAARAEWSPGNSHRNRSRRSDPETDTKPAWMAKSRRNMAAQYVSGLFGIFRQRHLVKLSWLVRLISSTARSRWFCGSLSIRTLMPLARRKAVASPPSSPRRAASDLRERADLVLSEAAQLGDRSYL